MSGDPSAELGRDQLRELSRRLTRLHAVLLARERQAYEDLYGPISPNALLQLLLSDPRFGWLRALSQLMTRVDIAVHGEDPVTTSDVDAFLRDSEGLLRSGASDAFGTRYRQALQESPSAVMAHADVVKMFPRRAAP